MVLHSKELSSLDHYNVIWSASFTWILIVFNLMDGFLI
jgi:hypothetical protein